MLQIASFNTKWIWGLLIISLGCSSEKQELPFYNTATFTPLFLSKAEATSKITHRIPEFELNTEHNKAFLSSALHGKIHVANFIFTQCGSICPKMTNHMNKVSTAFETDSLVVLLSFSVTPWLDTPTILETYKAHNTNHNKNWHFLTGNKARIYQLARQGYFAEEALGYTKDSTDFLHTEHFILVDKEQRIRGIYNGTLGLEIDQLISDIRVLKQEP